MENQSYSVIMQALYHLAGTHPEVVEGGVGDSMPGDVFC